METEEIEKLLYDVKADEEEIDIEKLKQLNLEDKKQRGAKNCADCHDERNYCFKHQKAKMYLSRFFDVGSNEYERLCREYLMNWNK